MTELAEWMATERRSAQWLSDQTGIARETIQRIKGGRVPSLQVAAELQRVTGIEATAFLRKPA